MTFFQNAEKLLSGVKSDNFGESKMDLGVEEQERIFCFYQKFILCQNVLMENFQPAQLLTLPCDEHLYSKSCCLLPSLRMLILDGTLNGCTCKFIMSTKLKPLEETNSPCVSLRE